MGVVTAAAIAGGASLLGGMMANSANQQMSKRAIRVQKRQFAEQMQFARNAVQIRAEDLKKAGFNPILVGNLGAAAQTPSPGGIPQPIPSKDVVTPAVSSVMNVVSQGIAAELNTSNATLSKENTKFIAEQIKHQPGLRNLTDKKAAQAAAVIGRIAYEIDQIEADTRRIQNSARYINQQTETEKHRTTVMGTDAKEAEIWGAMIDANPIIVELQRLGFSYKEARSMVTATKRNITNWWRRMRRPAE